MLTPDEVAHLPIYVVDLFPVAGLPPPRGIPEVQSHMMTLQYQNRFWADYGGTAELGEFVQMLDQVAALGKGNPVEHNAAYAWLLRLRALKNLRVIAGAPATASGGYDFSPYGVGQQCASGRDTVRRYLADNPAPLELARVA
jgi:NTE family protein